MTTAVAGSTTEAGSFGTTGSVAFKIPPFVFQPTIASYFGYDPSAGLAVSATVLFSVSVLLLIFLCVYFWRRRVLYFLVVPVVAGSMECLAYGLRARMAVSGDLPAIWEFIVSLVALIIAPIFVALGNYLVCGRIVRYVGVRYSLFKPVIIERFFVVSDVASFFVQAIGASVFASATTNNSAQSVFDTAQAILIAGFVIQLAALLLFLITCIYVDFRTRRHPHAIVAYGKWRRLFVALYISVFMVLIRSIYRTIEFEASRGSSLSAQINGHEVYFGVFETLAVFIAFSIYVPFHPGFYDISEPVVAEYEISTTKTTPLEVFADV